MKSLSLKAPWHRRMRAGTFVLACLSFAACRHHPNSSVYIRPDPISIHVENDNFLDADVAIDVGGVSRRLGQVIGNNKADYTFMWTNDLTGGVVMTAKMIGGGSARSLNLSVSPGQVVDFRIATVLRQTYATVHDP